MTITRPRGGLDAEFVRKVATAGRYGDGRGGFGLSLLVKRTAVPGRWSKTWSQRLTVGGRKVQIGLGAYPVVGLQQARDVALTNTREAQTGRDPRQGVGTPTFAAATERAIELRRAGWKDSGKQADRWRASMARHVFPHFGAKTVDKVGPADVVEALRPIWHAQPRTAKQISERINVVLDWAVGMGYRSGNPTKPALTALGPQPNGAANHHGAAHYDELPAVLARVDTAKAAEVVRLAVELIALTAVRSGEATGMVWAEVDGDTWTIPAERTKTNREHRVPLSVQARAVLDRAKTLNDDTALVFPSPRDRKIMHTQTTKRVADLVGLPTIHGLRSTFRDWAADHGVSREIAEACLAHSVGRVEAAYRRTDMLDARREVLQAWADHCRPGQS